MNAAPADSPLLIVAATAEELAPLRAALEPIAEARDDDAPGGEPVPTTVGRLEGSRVRLAVTGVGKTNTAWALGALLARSPVRAVLQLGIGGAYPEAFLPVGAAACASEEQDLDAGLATREGPRGMAALGFALLPDEAPPRFDRFPTDAAWTARLADACGTPPLPFATSDAVSGDLDVAEAREARSGAALESMEGSAGAQACLRAGVPFAELRGVSNVAGQREAVSWDARGAIGAATRALQHALRRLAAEGRGRDAGATPSGSGN